LSRQGHERKQGRARKEGGAKRGREGDWGEEARVRWRGAPPGAHEWASFDDPREQRTWRFDVTFLLSRWQCIYGRGCQGVLTAPAPELAEGCCSYGAHFTGPEDVARVKEAAKTLQDEHWQFAAQGRRRGVVRRGPAGASMTRLVQGACVFLNRPGFAGGPGCALHRAALERGQQPLELKPDVCWQLPLRREDVTGTDGSVTSTVGQWDRSHWGGGGSEFAWWCTEAPEAFRGAFAVWRAMSAELAAMVGAEVFDLLAGYLRSREMAGPPLPHPASWQRP
jgi:hypothetical protein